MALGAVVVVIAPVPDWRARRRRVSQLGGLREPDDSLIFQIGMVPSHVPMLVERNSSMATLLLTLIMQSPNNSACVGAAWHLGLCSQLTTSNASSARCRYLEKLLELDVTLQSLDTVRGMLERLELPQAFLRVFITSAISRCSSAPNQQHRIPRLVCFGLPCALPAPPLRACAVPPIARLSLAAWVLCGLCASRLHICSVALRVARDCVVACR